MKDDNELPAPEVLKPQGEGGTESPEESGGNKPAASGSSDKQQPPKRTHRGSYRPSHKATFISLGVVVAILAINAVIIVFVLKSQAKVKSAIDGQVSISAADLNKIGVNRSAVGDAGIQLTINPDTTFHGQVSVGGNLSVAGQLKLNGTFQATSANLSQLQAGDTQLSQLNVNGDGTISTLNLRKDLNVVGTTRLQGPAILSQLLTVNNSVNIAGNLAVGGTLSVSTFHTASLVSDNGIITGGHIITQGVAPGVSRGSALGPSGTVSISGNDISGTVAANAGVGGSTGQVACVTFSRGYSNTPHVVITPSAPVNAYVSRSASGFCIYSGVALSAGGYIFDYVVEQ